jgi:hypothetical protein
MRKEDLQKNVLVLKETAREGERWLSANESAQGNQEGIKKRLRRSARKLETYAKAADNKMGIAVFGPSQAGKSTFIGSLTKGNQKNLMVEFSAPGGKTTVLDFIWQVNPQGGGETTGLVTRFSLEAPPKSPNPNLPVCVKLFSEMDIIKILANTFFEEGKTAFNFEGDAINDFLARINDRLSVLEQRAGSQVKAPTLDEMEDLAEYVDNISKKYVYGNALSNSFWPRAVALAPRLHLRDRAELFSLIWGEAQEFTMVYEKLCMALEKLNFPAVAFTELKALYEENGDASQGSGGSSDSSSGDGDSKDRRTNSILYVGMLAGLLSDTDDAVEVMNPMGVKALIPRPIVCALVAELHVKLTESPGDFMNNADILDFPGYRARSEYTNFLADIKKPDNLKNCFLRGKVDYVFQRYVVQKEVTVTLLCVRSGNFECPGLPEAIKNWVEETHGRTPKDRTGKPVCLFFVLTFFNDHLKPQLGSEDIGLVWSKRFLSSLIDAFGKDGWPTSWSLEGNMPRAFRNCYWHLDPYYTKEFLNVETLDEKTKLYVARGVRDEQRKWLGDLKAGYLKNDSVNTFIQNPEEAWDGALESSDGGVAYIISKLTPVVSKDIKTMQLADLALREGESVRDTLAAFYHGDDNKEEKEKKLQIFSKLSDALFCLGNSDNAPPDLPYEFLNKMTWNRFGSLLRDLIFTDDDCFEFFSLPYRSLQEELASMNVIKDGLGGPAKDDLSGTRAGTPKATTGSIRGRFGKKDGNGKDKSPAPPVLRQDDSARTYRVVLEKRWKEKLEDLANGDITTRYYGLAQNDFRALILELEQGARRLKVFDAIEDAMRIELDYGNINPEKRLWKFCRLASAHLSEYVSYLGLSPRRKNREERTVLIEFMEDKMTLFEPTKEDEDFPSLPENAPSYENEYNVDWQMALAKLMADNVDFSEANYDKVQNASLGGIIQRLDTDAGELRAGTSV